MDLSLKQLEEAVGLRRQIDALEGRLTRLLRGNGMSSSKVSSSAGEQTEGRLRTMWADTRRKLRTTPAAAGAKVRGRGSGGGVGPRTGNSTRRRRVFVQRCPLMLTDHDGMARRAAERIEPSATILAWAGSRTATRPLLLRYAASSIGGGPHSAEAGRGSPS